jgi:type II secretion system (T2SS) protein E
VSDDALDLAFRAGLPFVGLRDHEHDPELDTVVPPDAARSARAVPLAAAGDHVRLAVADPDTDLTALTPYLAGRRVELAIAPGEEVDAVLGPADLAPAPPARSILDQAAPRDEELMKAGAEQPRHEAAEPQLPAPPEPPLAPEPDPLAADPAVPPLAEAEHPAAATEREPEPLAAESEREPRELEPLAAEPEPPPPAAEPEAPEAADEPQPPAQPAGEPPSWLEPPRKRSRLRVAGLVLLILLLLAVIGGAIAAYFLTR